ncbi:MAG: STAS domain-containing protein [Chitinivibrionales bacterium]|nr:STAS domain-containing protein [Chitinivibrionales bacterium]
MMDRESGVTADFEGDLALITCEGVINNEKTRGLASVWHMLKQATHTRVLLDLSNTNNIYSCGLGVLLRMHKEAEESGGMLVISGAQGYVKTIFESTKVNRVLHLAPDNRLARELFGAQRNRYHTQESADRAPQQTPAQQHHPAYWEFRQHHSRRDGHACVQCKYAGGNPQLPCWIVEGEIEGVSFRYINEDCEKCDYFKNYGTAAQPDNSSS